MPRLGNCRVGELQLQLRLRRWIRERAHPGANVKIEVHVQVVDGHREVCGGQEIGKFSVEIERIRE